MKQRNIGLDYLRIISMLGIISLHIIGCGGLAEAAKGTQSIVFINMVSAISYCSVNVFAMLSGYLYVEKENIMMKNIISLIFVMLFYSACITIFFIIIYPYRYNGLYSYLFSLFPSAAGRYWYITSYVFMFFLIPYINTFICSISKNDLKKLIIVLFILLSIIPTFGLYDYFRILGGYSPWWLIFCYIIGAYAKLYFNKFVTKKTCLLIFCGNIVLITSISSIFEGHFTYIFNQYTSPFMVINSFFILLFFSQIKVGIKEKCKRIIVSISNAAFSVYIIHSHIMVYDYIIKDSFMFAEEQGVIGFVGIYIFSLFGIYIVCYLIDFIRKIIFKCFMLDKLSIYLGNKFDKLLF